jgi:hypothetical protein
MKKILTLLAILLVSQNINSQQSEFVVEYCSVNSTFQSSKGLICSNDMRTKWFAINPTYLSSTTKPIPNGFSLIKLNIGKSTKNDKLIIRFEGNKTVVLKAYDVIPDYGGIIMFYANITDIHVFKNHTIKSIKYVNGDDGQTFTYYPDDNEKTFFLNLFTKFVIKDVKCD